MTFWKRNHKSKVNKEKVKEFENVSDNAEEDIIIKGEIDWLTLVPKPKKFKLEDAVVKSDRLKSEGSSLAEIGRYWEALKKFNEAINLTPNNEIIYELIAQSYMQVGELMPAVNAAENAVRINPNWWISHQTLGRALLNIGEVDMALKCFKKALHLNPSDEELWNVDLKWSLELLEKKKFIEEEKLKMDTNNTSSIIITELKDDSVIEVDLDMKDSNKRFQCRMSNVEKFDIITKVPDSYVIMR